VAETPGRAGDTAAADDATTRRDASRRAPPAMRATPAVRASARVPRATTRTPATTNRRAAMMTTLTLTLTSTTRRDADARDDDDDDDAATFYARWPYREPRDVIPYLERRATRGDGASILEAYDAFFARYPTYALGRAKAALLGRELDRAPKLECCVEIGTFLGYSAIATAMRFKSARARMLCVEYEARHAEVARWALAYAGLDDRVRVLTAAGSEAVGDARAFVESVKGVGTTEGADVLFLDHAKERYLPDLKLYEDAGVVRPGTIVVADNVVYPGAPGYLEYVDSSAGRYDTHLLEAMFEYEQVWKGEEGGPKKDALSVSVKRA
jgi:catechol O-methyltransferase/protein arginine N-methyltransferase 5